MWVVVKRSSALPGVDRARLRVVTVRCTCGATGCFAGRVHLYEGVDPQQLRIPMYTLKVRTVPAASLRYAALRSSGGDTLCCSDQKPRCARCYFLQHS